MRGENHETELIITSIRITEEQREWLDEHPEVNLSGLVRRRLDEKMLAGELTGDSIPTPTEDEIRSAIADWREKQQIALDKIDSLRDRLDGEDSRPSASDSE